MKSRADSKMAFSDDLFRQLNELAVRYGRKLQSKQTGYLHLCYHPGDEDKHDTIPSLENFLFALALLKSKTSENVIEARSILEKLIKFQQPDGNFPVYLHEYPLCRDVLLGAQLLPTLYWIQKLFNTVLGNDLLQQIKKASELLLNFSLKIAEEKLPRENLAVKIGSSAIALGSLWGNDDFVKKGEKLVAKLNPEHTAAWLSPSGIADFLIADQLSSLSKTPFGKQFYEFVNKTWHVPTRTYAGPPFHEFQQGKEPQATLYDLFMGSANGGISEKSPS